MSSSAFHFSSYCLKVVRAEINALLVGLSLSGVLAVTTWQLQTLQDADVWAVAAVLQSSAFHECSFECLLFCSPDAHASSSVTRSTLQEEIVRDGLNEIWSQRRWAFVGTAQPLAFSELRPWEGFSANTERERGRGREKQVVSQNLRDRLGKGGFKETWERFRAAS